ncbi:hypothetical protein [Nonomuraea sp. NPDC050783]|uniref:hypothetical protein n=1 Tax=Nonomuraea sp. NPDC050783 TaxID=3154634 RepID=UPI00346523C1
MTASNAGIVRRARWAPALGTMCLMALGIAGAGPASPALADAQSPPSMCFDGPDDCQPQDFDNMFRTKNTPWDCHGNKTLPRRFCQTDNSTLTVWRQKSVAPSGWTRIKEVLKDDFDARTDLKVKFVRKPVYTGDAETDVIYKKPEKFPAGVVALTWCDNRVDELKCDQHYVLLKGATPSKELACHETGHAVGLTHGNRAYPAVSNEDSRLGCLRTPPRVGVQTLGGHNRRMINKTY